MLLVLLLLLLLLLLLELLPTGDSNVLISTSPVTERNMHASFPFIYNSSILKRDSTTILNNNSYKIYRHSRQIMQQEHEKEFYSNKILFPLLIFF